VGGFRLGLGLALAVKPFFLTGGFRREAVVVVVEVDGVPALAAFFLILAGSGEADLLDSVISQLRLEVRTSRL